MLEESHLDSHDLLLLQLLLSQVELSQLVAPKEGVGKRRAAEIFLSKSTTQTGFSGPVPAAAAARFSKGDASCDRNDECAND